MAILQKLPGYFQYSKYEKESPFSLYCSYIDLVRPVDIQMDKENNAEELDQINKAYQSQKAEYESVKGMYNQAQLLSHKLECELECLQDEHEKSRQQFENERFSLKTELHRLKLNHQQEIL